MKKVEVYEFVMEQIREAKKNGHRGFNPVFSGLNSFLRNNLNIEPRLLYEEMKKKNLIDIVPIKKTITTKSGKVMEVKYVVLYLKGDAPSSKLDEFKKKWEEFTKRREGK